MGQGLNKPLWAALFMGLVAWTYAPILMAGPFGVDLELLAGLSGRGSAALYSVPHTDGRPLAALSLFLSRAVWSAERVWPAHLATWLRLENLAVLAVAAQGLRIALRRLFTPWFGEETARAASLVAGLLLMVHPLPVAAVAMVHLRGELLALAFGAFALASFLEARQEHNPRLLGRAFLFAFLAGMSGRWALFLPFLFGILEALSSHRHRRSAARWRAAGLTFVVSGVCVAAEFILRGQLAPEAARTYQYLSVHLEAIPFSVEKLGVLLMPAPVGHAGVLAIPVALATLILATHPGFVAARGAPRLWGRIVAVWGSALLLSLILDADQRVVSLDLVGAQVLLGATMILCTGWGLASTAVSDGRRIVMPTLLVLLFAWLAHGTAQPFRLAGNAIDSVRTDLEQAAGRRIFRGSFVLVAPEERVEGHRILPEDPSILLSRRLAMDAWGKVPEGGPFVRVISKKALAAWWGSSDYSERAEAGLCFLVPPLELGQGAGPLMTFDGIANRDLPKAFVLQGSQMEAEASSVVGEGRLVPAWYTQIRVMVPEGLAGAEPPLLEWQAGNERHGSQQGVWVTGRTEDLLEARFDMRGNPAWIFAERLTHVRAVGPLAGRDLLLSSEVGLLPTDAQPRWGDTGWIVNIGDYVPPVVAPMEGRDEQVVEWVLWRLDCDSLRRRDFALESLDSTRLVAPFELGGKGERELRQFTKGGIWGVECQLDGVVVAASRGPGGPSPSLER